MNRLKNGAFCHMLLAFRLLITGILLTLPFVALGQSAPRAERLLEQKSPYLRRHADNLVEWHPWGDAAFSKAKSLNRPVFMTVGYSTSPWCGTIEQEAFLNEEIATFLNDNFVCVLVDREERPAGRQCLCSLPHVDQRNTVMAIARVHDPRAPPPFSERPTFPTIPRIGAMVRLFYPCSNMCAQAGYAIPAATCWNKAGVIQNAPKI